MLAFSRLLGVSASLNPRDEAFSQIYVQTFRPLSSKIRLCGRKRQHLCIQNDGMVALKGGFPCQLAS